MGLTRRAVLAAAGAGAGMALTGKLYAQGAQHAAFPLPSLPYSLNALEPALSERAVALHVEFHRRALARLNALVKDTDYAAMPLEEVAVAALDAGEVEVHDYASQVWNHTFYFESFAGGWSTPGPALDEALNREYGGLEGLADALVAAAEDNFGVGWIWLTAEGDGLFLETVPDATNPLGTDRLVLMGVDLWEHAYYLDYQDRRADYLRALVTKLVNWEAADLRFMDG